MNTQQETQREFEDGILSTWLENHILFIVSFVESASRFLVLTSCLPKRLEDVFLFSGLCLQSDSRSLQSCLFFDSTLGWSFISIHRIRDQHECLAQFLLTPLPRLVGSSSSWTCSFLLLSGNAVSSVRRIILWCLSLQIPMIRLLASFLFPWSRDLPETSEQRHTKDYGSTKTTKMEQQSMEKSVQ
jgi:hypothetical protein